MEKRQDNRRDKKMKKILRFGMMMRNFSQVRNLLAMMKK